MIKPKAKGERGQVGAAQVGGGSTASGGNRICPILLLPLSLFTSSIRGGSTELLITLLGLSYTFCHIQVLIAINNPSLPP